MGVRLMNLASGDSVVALARNAESAEADAVEDVEAGENPGNEIVDESNDLGDDGVLKVDRPSKSTHAGIPLDLVQRA